MKVPVIDNKTMVRDMNSGAILIQNDAGYEEYKKRKQEILEKQKKSQQLENEINTMKQDIKELKEMVQCLIHALHKS